MMFRLLSLPSRLSRARLRRRQRGERPKARRLKGIHYRPLLLSYSFFLDAFRAALVHNDVHHYVRGLNKIPLRMQRKDFECAR